MQDIPAGIEKSFIGYVFITAAGFGLVSLLAAGVYAMWRAGDLTESIYWIGAFIAIVILLITMLQLYVYNLSFVELTENGIHVVNWRTTFVKQDVTTEWARVQDVTVGTTSVWSLMFNYGHLTIQTSGTAQDLKMTMIPNAEYWQALIQDEADEAA